MITIVQQELTRLSEPRPCGINSATMDALIFCGAPAIWAIDGIPVCLEDIRVIAGMNSDNEAFLMPALEDTV